MCLPCRFSKQMGGGGLSLIGNLLYSVTNVLDMKWILLELSENGMFSRLPLSEEES